MTASEPLADEVLDDEPEDWDVGEPRLQTGGIGSVRGDHNISVTDPRGAVVLMEHVAFHLRSAASDAGTDASWSPRLVPEDVLTDLAARFVLPPGYGDLVRRLRDPGTVVLSGAPGCGRRSAALMALKESGEGATRFRELPDDDADEFVLDPTIVERDERLLLDLSAETRPIPSRVLTGLRAYRAAVADKQAFLAIVLPPEQQGVAAELGTAAMIIGRPDGAEVFRRRLALSQIDVTEQELRDDVLRGHLTRDPMRHLVALAERVRHARGEMAGQGGWAAWLAAALKTDTHLNDVARFVRDNPDGRVRALLLAAALFEHATPEAVESAAAALLEVAKYPPAEEHSLDLPDLAEALDKVKATIDERRVRFGSVAYADAVRTHFWRTFPHLRGVLRSWVAKSVESKAVSAPARSLAVLRYTDQCLRNELPDDLCQLVERWARASPSTPDRMLDVAGVALTRGLLSERYGRWFRRRVYLWVTNRQLWPSLATLLVGLTEGVIAPARPDQGLVRLRHLTRHASTGVVAEARAALVRLCRDGRFARRLLTRVRADLVGDRPRDVDYALFLDVADPVRLTARDSDGFPRVGERSVRDLVVDGWAECLAHRTFQDIAPAVTRWLDAHADEPGRVALVEILAAATRGSSQPGAVLYAVSRDWVATAAPDQRSSRWRTAALLRQACADIRQEPPPSTASLTTQGVST